MSGGLIISPAFGELEFVPADTRSAGDITLPTPDYIAGSRPPLRHHELLKRHQKNNPEHAANALRADCDDTSSAQDFSSQSTNSTIITSEDHTRVDLDCNKVAKVFSVSRAAHNHGQDVRNPAPVPEDTPNKTTRGKRRFQTTRDVQEYGDDLGKRIRRRTTCEVTNRSTFDPVKQTLKPLASAKAVDFFEVEKFSAAKQDEDGNIKLKAHWTPIWVRVENLQGMKSYKAAERLIVANLGQDVWTKVSDNWQVQEPHALESIEYAEN